MPVTDPWCIDNYVKKYPYSYWLDGVEQPMTMWSAKRIFQLSPDPPEVEHENEYILRAQQQPNRDAFCFFLHHYETRLNRRIKNLTVGDAELRYHPDRFMDIKMACVQKMLELLPAYDPAKGATFATFIYERLHEAVREFWQSEEAWTIDKPEVYRKIRHAGYVRSQCPDLKTAVHRFMEETGCTQATAEKRMADAANIRNRQSIWLIDDDTGQETCDVIVPAPLPEKPVTAISGIPIEVIREAFWSLKLDRHREILEARLAIDMKAGEAKPMDEQMTLEELAARYCLTGPSSIQNGLEKALQAMGEYLWSHGWAQAVKFQRLSKTKTAAVYQYQADCDGEWGEIHFDLKNGTAIVRTVAEWDSSQTKRYANEIIRRMNDSGKFPKAGIFYFP